MSELNLMKFSLNGPEHTQGLLQALKTFGVTLVVELAVDVVIVEFDRTWFTLADNGGEFNILRINSEDYIPSIPYDTAPASNIGSIAYRVKQAMEHGCFEMIDWLFDAADINPTRVYPNGPMEVWSP